MYGLKLKLSEKGRCRHVHHQRVVARQGTDLAQKLPPLPRHITVYHRLVGPLGNIHMQPQMYVCAPAMLHGVQGYSC